MKKVLLTICLGLLLFGCNKSDEYDIKKLMKENDHIIVDVRTKEEYEELHLTDSINIPHDEIENDELDKNKIIFVYCASGARSKIAYDKLISLGYTVYDLGALANINLPKE